MIKKKKQEIEQGMKSVRGRETSQISMIKVRGSGREWEGARGSGRKREGMGGSGKEWGEWKEGETAEAEGST